MGQASGLPSEASLLIDCLPAVDSRALINRQLDRILWLNDRLSACKDGQRRAQMFRELCDGAVLHILSRERVLLPAWRRVGWKKFPLASFRAHVQFKRRLADLVVRPPSVEGHSDALDAFASHVEHQRALDDECLVPSLRCAMDVPQRRDVCNDMELLFGSDRVAANVPVRIDASPRELVHEAQVVLSSLAPHRESRHGRSS
jgi:hypothetical protein